MNAKLDPYDDRSAAYPRGHVRCWLCEGTGHARTDGGLFLPPPAKCADCDGKGHRPPLEADVTELKRQWTQDPCWDIETTDGFENHVDELRAFRKHWEAVCTVRAEVKQINDEIAALDKQRALLGDRRAHLQDVILLLNQTFGLRPPGFAVGVG